MAYAYVIMVVDEDSQPISFPYIYDIWVNFSGSGYNSGDIEGASQTSVLRYGGYVVWEASSSHPSTIGVTITDRSGYFKTKTATATRRYYSSVDDYPTQYDEIELVPNTNAGYVTVLLAANPTTNNGNYVTIATVSASSGTAYLGLGSSSSSSPSSWVSSPLQVTYSGTYYIWKKCDAASGYDALSPTYVGSVTVSKGAGSLGTAAITPASRTYSSESQTFLLRNTGGTNTVQYWKTLSGDEKLTVTGPPGASYNASLWSISNAAGGILLTTESGLAAGTYSVTISLVQVTETIYYYQTAGSMTWSITISKADQAAPTVTGDSNTYATSGSISGSASGGGGQGTLYYRIDTNGGTNYGLSTTTAPTRNRNSIGTTTFIAYWSGNSNYNASPNSSQGVLTISKSAGYVNTAPTNNGVTYNSGSYLCSAGSNASGTIYYSLSYSTGYSQTRPTATSDLNAGSYIVYYYAAATTNYEQSQIYSVAVTIVKAPYPYAFGISPTSATIYSTSGYNTVGIAPYNNYSSVSYSSSNSSVATVTTTSSRYGDVTYKAAGTAYIYATASGGTNYEDAVATCTITCTEDYIVNYDYAPSGYWARLTIGSGLSASGGSAGVTATGGHNYYYLYASGYYTGPYSTSSDGASWSITYDNNSRFYKSGNYLYHRSMGTTETTDYVTITATNGSGSVDANRSITNSLESISLSVSKNPISYDESTTCSVSATYTSGASADVTSSAQISVGASGIVTIS